jgi:hypothetical protein
VIYTHSSSPLYKHYDSLSLVVSWQLISTQKLSLQITTNITHEIFQSHFTSSQADLLYSPVVLVSLRLLPPLVPLLICSEHLAFTWTLPTTNCLGRPSFLQDNPSARTKEKTHLPIWLPIRGNVYIEPSPRNGFGNTAVLLLRNLPTDCLRRDCLRGNSFSISLPSNNYKHSSYRWARLREEIFIVPMHSYTCYNIF